MLERIVAEQANCAARRAMSNEFLALPIHLLADAALSRARELGCRHTDVRVERVRRGSWLLRDGRLVSASDWTDTGAAVRVLSHGGWGFASTVHLRTDDVVRAVDHAVELARLARSIS